MTDAGKRWESKVKEDGHVSVPISRKVARRLEALRRDGEDDDSLLRRMLDDVNAKIVPDPNSPAVSWENLSGKERRAARKIASVLGNVPAGERDAFFDKIIWGLKTDSTSSLLEAASRLRPDQRERVVGAVVGKTATSVLEALGPALDEHMSDLQRTVKKERDNLDRVTRIRDSLAELKTIAAEPVLQKLGESGWYKCMAAMPREIILSCVDPATPIEHAMAECPVAPPCFVVQHDWASAFAKAGDFSEGEYRLPYDDAVFEFRISSARCCLIVDTDAGSPRGAALYVETKAGWALASLALFEHGIWTDAGHNAVGRPIFDLCAKQVRAIAISLEAEVAVTEIVRAPAKLNAKRERAGKLPLFDYHVIDLARRSRPSPLPDDVERSTHASPRLHFRRGHWRHFVGHKTWINWMLVGNPDLGFVDKHYKL